MRSLVRLHIHKLSIYRAVLVNWIPVYRIRVQNNKRGDNRSSDTNMEHNGLIVRTVLEFVGPKQFIWTAPINRRFYEEYKKLFGTETAWKKSFEVTSLPQYAIDRLRLLLRLQPARYGSGDEFQYSDLCKYAAEAGNLPLLQWLRENTHRVNLYHMLYESEESQFQRLYIPEPYREHPRIYSVLALDPIICRSPKRRSKRKRMDDWNSLTCAAAASQGHLEVLKWARDNGCEWDSLTCANAARNGHLVLLNWAFDNGCQWDSLTCAYAAGSGRLDVLQFARDNGCEWDYRTFHSAARNGHLHILQWAYANGGEWDDKVYYRAIMKGHLDIVQWAHSIGFKLDEEACNTAALYGHLHVLRWIMANTTTNAIYTDVCYFMVIGEDCQLETLQWALDNNCELNEWVCYAASEKGRLDVLRWARSNGCGWDRAVCSIAAGHGNLNILQWARHNGCSWNANTCAEAALHGHFNILKWARRHGCAWNWKTCAMAARNGHVHILKWARRNGCKWNSKACSYAAESGHLEVLQWLRDNGCEWDETVCTAAARNGHFHIVKWARKHGCPWTKHMVYESPKSRVYTNRIRGQYPCTIADTTKKRSISYPRNEKNG